MQEQLSVFVQSTPFQRYSVSDRQSTPAHQQCEKTEPRRLVPAFHPALGLIDVSCIDDFLKLESREVIRRRTISSDSTQQNGWIGLDPAESQALVKESDYPFLLFLLREGATDPGVAKSFQIRGRNLGDVREAHGSGPR